MANSCRSDPAKISGVRPLGQARRNSDDGHGGGTGAARRSSSLQRRRQQRADPARTVLWCSRRAGARVLAASPGRMAGGRSNAAAARAPRGQRPRSREADDRGRVRDTRVEIGCGLATNDNGSRADVILALDRLTHRQSPTLRAEAGAAPASYPILCTNLGEEDRQTKEDS